MNKNSQETYLGLILLISLLLAFPLQALDQQNNRRQDDVTIITTGAEPGDIEDPDAASGDNLINNYSFEQSTSGWSTMYSGNTLSRSSAQSYIGAYSGKIARTTANTKRGIQANIMSKLNDNKAGAYGASFRVRLSQTATIMISIKRKRSGENMVSTSHVVTANANTWTYISVYTKTYVQDFIEGSLCIENSTLPVAATMYVDDARLKKFAHRPFPQQKTFANCIKPSNTTQAQMNATIEEYYLYWKNAYLKESNGTTPDGYYIEMVGTGGDGITTSEAHGYGMIIFALIDRCNASSSTRAIFDGMYKMYNDHRSTIDNDNMSWIIGEDEDPSSDSDSATDGDMDIAYALILADRQWGSDGNINYLNEAKRIITNGIKAADMSTTTKRSKLGDWDKNGLNTRSSDWMTSHFVVFKSVTNDTFWDEARNKDYSLISSITANFSPNTGLMPDFVVKDPPKPAEPNFLEGPNDGDFSWNACRYPWRIAMDYAHNGKTTAKTACDKIIGWIRGKTSQNPAKINAGYKLNGNNLATDTSMAFTAPMMVACIVNSSNQAYLNMGWNIMKDNKIDYYSDTINLLCMLLISGNWWKP